ncbi:MAG: methyltransferase [Hyphococcus sp.]|nr:MAG: methyltransferase [Marinicaulis sp.]
MTLPARHFDQIPFGTFAPNLLGKAGLAFGRALPAGKAGLKLAGIGRPLALAGIKSGVADIEALGLKLRLHPRDNLCEKRLFMTPQCFDPVELEVLRAAMTPAAVFLDIGANAGAYSLVAAKAGGPHARIIAVEPQQEMRARMNYNAQLNGLHNIETIGAALSDYEGESVLRMVESNRGRASLEGEGRESSDAVRVLTLKTLLEETGLERIDVMKIDVEGGEARILSAFFAEVERPRWPGLIIMERPQVNARVITKTGNPALADENAVALACRHGYRISQETRLNAVLIQNPDPAV